jgi:SAM-dependent methyltransferase
MSRMSSAAFEARYRAEADPWSYADSDYERAKYAATLRACGRGPFRRALELGSSIGVFTALLAPRCEHLVAVEQSPTAIDRARERLAGRERGDVELVLGPLPEAIPCGDHDLVVASEVLYYLTSDELTRTLAALERGMEHGARLVAVHWRPPGPERPLSALEVHAALAAAPWLSPLQRERTDDYLLDVLERW